MPDPEPTTEPAPDPTPTPDPPPAQELDWKAEARKWEKRAKENTDAAARLAALEDAQKTDQQLLQEALEASQTDGAAAKAQAAMLTAALEHGLSKDDLELLEGVPSDQIADRAARLAARINTHNSAPPASKNQGGDGGAPDVNPDQLAEQIWNQHRI